MFHEVSPLWIAHALSYLTQQSSVTSCISSFY